MQGMYGLSDKDVEFVNDFMAEFNVCEQYQQLFEQKWRSYYKLWRCYVDEDNWAFKAKIFVPYVYSIIRTLMAMFMTATFEVDPLIKIMPTKGTPSINAEIMEALLAAQMRDMDIHPETNTHNSIYCAGKDGFMYGTGCLKFGWKQNFQEKIYRLHQHDYAGNLTGDSIEYPRIDTIFDGPVFTYVPIENIFVPPTSNVMNIPYVIQRIFVNYEDLVAENKYSKRYKNLDKLKDYSYYQITGDSNWRCGICGYGTVQEMVDNPRAMLLEKVTKNSIETIGNSYIPMRKSEVNYKHGMLPYLFFRPEIIPNEFYGLGTIAPIETQQHELNARRCMLLDNDALSSNVVLIINRRSRLNPDEVELFPGARYVVDTDGGSLSNAIDTLKIPQISTTLNDEKLIKQDIDMASGVYDTTRGALPQHSQQPTTILALEQQVNKVFDMIMKSFERDIIRPLGFALTSLNQQYFNKERVVKIIGEGYDAQKLVANPYNIQGHFDYKFSGSSIRDKGVAEGNLLKIFNVVAPVLSNPQMMNNPVMTNFVKLILDKFEIPVDKVFKIPMPSPQPPIGMPAPPSGQPTEGGIPNGGQPPAGIGMPPELMALMGNAPPTGGGGMGIAPPVNLNNLPPGALAHALPNSGSNPIANEKNMSSPQPGRIQDILNLINRKVR